MEATTTNNVENLWSTKFDFGIGEIMPPVAILKQQAALLGQQTRNLVIGSVTAFSGRRNDEISYGLFINAPAISYNTELFSIFVPVLKMYPVELYLAGTPPNEKKPDFIAHDEKTFKERLREVLASERVVSTIQSLIAQSVATSS